MSNTLPNSCISRMSSADEESFFAFCREHRSKLDPSYLGDQDLLSFPSPVFEHTFLEKRPDGGIVGACSLMGPAPDSAKHEARFRILYSISGLPTSYRSLLKAVAEDVPGGTKMRIFVPQSGGVQQDLLISLGFHKERTTYLMVREGGETSAPSLPPGYGFKDFARDSDEHAWCDIRNEAFRTVIGNDSPVFPDDIRMIMQSEGHLAQGMVMVEHSGKPVGVAMGTKESFKERASMNIGPVAVLPAHQGKGLGRAMIRLLLGRAASLSLNVVTLSVNADNSNALSLYLSEGFMEAESFACLAAKAGLKTQRIGISRKRRAQ